MADGDCETDGIDPAERVRVQDPIEGGHALQPAMSEDAVGKRGCDQYQRRNCRCDADGTTEIAGKAAVMAMRCSKHHHTGDAKHGSPDMHREAVLALQAGCSSGEQEHGEVAGETGHNHQEAWAAAGSAEQGATGQPDKPGAGRQQHGPIDGLRQPWFARQQPGAQHRGKGDPHGPGRNLLVRRAQTLAKAHVAACAGWSTASAICRAQSAQLARRRSARIFCSIAERASISLVRRSTSRPQETRS